MNRAEAGAVFQAALENAEQFFMGTAKVQQAMNALAKELDADGIPYAVVGAMALNLHGYERVTKDVDVVLTREGLAKFKERHLGRGYVEKFAGSRGLRDTVHGVAIDVVIAGDFPGDGRPKPVAFPDPAAVAERAGDIAVVPLAKLVELKIASGMSAPHRLKDLADALEVIRIRRLGEDFAEQLDPYVRDKYRELWTAAQGARDDEE